MRGPYAHGEGALDLGAQFDLDFLRVYMLFVFPVVMKISVFIDQAWYFIRGRDGAPAVVDSLARQREVQPKVGVRMGLGIVGHLREPGARHHQACGIDRPSFQCLDGRSIHGVGFAQVVGMDDDELCAGRVAEAVG